MLEISISDNEEEGAEGEEGEEKKPKVKKEV